MGVTKVLMASNDTLFNFEDTLGDRDRDDLLISPRNYPKTNSNTTSTDTSLIIEGQNLLRNDNEDEDDDSDMNTFHINDDVTVLKENLRLFELKNTLNEANVQQTINDLLSPEQQKTFSEEIYTMEQLSSDLSGTIEATYTANTLDDLKTCISVHSKDAISSSTSVPISNVIEPEMAIKPNITVLQIETVSNTENETDCEMVQLSFVGNGDINLDTINNYAPVPENIKNLEIKQNNVQIDSEQNSGDCGKINEILANNSSSQEFTNDTKENENPNILKLLDKRPKIKQIITDKHKIQLNLNAKVDITNMTNESILSEAPSSITE